ncbi:MAG: DUF1287 domain-containing protein [Hyphomicrobium sp.]
MKKPLGPGAKGGRRRVGANKYASGRAPPELIVVKTMQARASGGSPLRSIAHRPALRVLAQSTTSAEPTATVAASVAPPPAAAPSPKAPQKARSRIDRAAASVAVAALAAAMATLILKPDGLSSARVAPADIAVAAAPALAEPPSNAAAADALAPPPSAPIAAPNSGDRASLDAVPVETLAALAVPGDELSADGLPTDALPVTTEQEDDLDGRERRCELDERPVAPAASLLAAVAKAEISATDFGIALSEAALAQTRDFVVYTDGYKRLKFPLGDVSAMFGVCTDVVIRAYRALGVDLQSLVHKSRVGSGDSSIDHRRTEVLRRFFSTHGRSLPASDVAEDYAPGDIVSYHRPQNNGSQSHIAIVSNIIGHSGRPLIVHNRGWGPQLEDALFVDQITGHYRYAGPVDGRVEAVVKLRIRSKALGSVRRKGARSTSKQGFRQPAGAAKSAATELNDTAAILR